MAPPKPRKRLPGESKASYQNYVAAFNTALGTGTDSGTVKHPYGVGVDYQASVTRPGPHSGEGPLAGYGPRADYGHTTKVPPRYYTGAATEIFGSMDQNTLMEVQLGLVRLGLLKKVTGVFNDATRSAVVTMLGGANAAGVGWKRWLRDKVAWLDENGIDTLGGSESTRQPLSIQLSNPDEIRAAVGAQSTNLLGGNYAGDPNQYVNEIHAAETKQQTDAYNQTNAGAAGGTTVAPPTVDSLIIKKHPLDYSVEQMGANAQAALSLIQRRTAESRG